MMLRGALLCSLCLVVSGTTCGSLKSIYKDSSCCGNPEKTIMGALNCGTNVTLAMVTAAQKAWGDGIIAISKSYTDGGDYEQVARDHINNLYGYAEGEVLFKPTLAADRQFRGTFDGAVSYFVAKNDEAPDTVIAEDSGFAIKGWTAVRFDNTEVITTGSTALAMGNYFFTNSNGDTKVEYTFGYFLDAAGDLRINAHHSALPYASPVTLAMVTAAQKDWGDGIIAISQSYTDGGDYEQVARDHINNLYGYAEGVVLFKPTLAAAQQFRGTFNGALSYFVAKNTQEPATVISEDSGFAIKGWTAVRFENTEVVMSGSTATAMGNYFFTNTDGETKVEYTFGYFLDAEGVLRINAHHSALPYAPQVTMAMVTAAQEAWGNGIIAIAQSYTDDGDYEQVARDHITNLYGYAEGVVLFKPTLAAHQQFRGTFDSALSYFVAKNTQAPDTVISEDSGFAIKGWTAVRFDNTEVVMSGSTAMAMGNYFFTNSNGETKVEYTFGYFMDAEGVLRINAHHSALPYPRQVTRENVTAAQKAWGDGIIAIAQAHTDEGDYEQVARDHINNLYGYAEGVVLFKPTLAADQQFRGTFDGALSYFVAKNDEAPNTVIAEDSGFAIKGWTAVRFENEGIITSDSTATAMGNYFFTNSDGETKVEYSFGYFLDAEGELRINLHSSHLPYDP